MQRDNDQLGHSVAFRVTETEWVTLQSIAEDHGVALPQLAKQLLFKSAGLRYTEPKKRTKRRASRTQARKSAPR